MSDYINNDDIRPFDNYMMSSFNAESFKRHSEPKRIIPRSSLTAVQIKELRKKVKARIKETKQKILDLNTERETYYRDVINPAHYREQPKLIEQLSGRMEYWYERFEKDLERYRKQLYSLDYKENLITPESITDADIARAKEVPIQTILEMSRNRFAKCPFHNDRHPSFHVYPDNHGYCFSCHQSGDVIDIAQEINGMSFKEAVKWLLHK